MRIEPISTIPVIDAQEHVARKPISPAISAPNEPNLSANSISSADSLKVQRETADGKGTVYQLVDDRTGAVVAQVPSEQVLNVADSIEQLIQQEIQKPKLDVKS